jgi:dethiobiotin synthetase
VAGTGTDVGKTFVGAALLRALRARNHAVAACKPVQSFAPDDRATDADLLAAATGQVATDVCPPDRWIPLPFAPPMAAEALGLSPFTVDDLVAETTTAVTRHPHSLTLVETAGGVRSPIAADGDGVALLGALAPALVVLVADAGLGTISLVRLSVDALRDLRLVVYLNRFDARSDLHVRNAQWLATREGLDIVTDIEALTAFVEQVAASATAGN